MGIVESEIARHVVDTRYEDLPAETIATVKEKVLDTIGVIVAGSASPGSDAVAGLLTDWGGRADSTVLVSGARIPAPHAAQIHGTWAHADEFCDSDDRQTLKCSATVVPVALALAQMAGAGGKDAVLAIALGYDIGCRMGLALTPQPATIGHDEGVFSGSIAGAKLLGLDEESVLDAMGAAYTQLAVAGMSLVSPSMTKRLIPGQVNRAAAWAALLAQRGFVTGRDLLQGPKGYYQTFRGHEGDGGALTADLGERFEVTHCPKPYPSGRFVHPAVDAAIELRRAHGFTAEDVTGVTVLMSTRSWNAIGGVGEAGRAAKQTPGGMVDAQTSTPYNVAVALRTGAVTLADFTDAAIHDPATLAVAAKIEEEPDPALDEWPQMITPVVVEIRLADGRALSQRVDHARGSPENPLSTAELREKFRGCIAHGLPTMPEENVRRALEMLDDFEQLDDVGPLLGLFTSAPIS